jgi:two-component system NtrC family sensor kinase
MESPISSSTRSETETGNPSDALLNRAHSLAELQMALAHMGSESDFEAFQVQLVRGVGQVLGGGVGALVLLDEPQDGWMVCKTLDDDQAPEGGVNWIYQVYLKETNGLVKDCLKTRQALYVNDVSADSRYDPTCDGLSGRTVHSLICAPLLANGRTLGAIKVLDERLNAYDDFDLDLLSTIAALASSAIHHQRAIQALKVANADLEAGRWELLSSRNTLRALFDHLPVALYIVDAEYRLGAVNKSRATRAGSHSPKSLVGQLCYQALFNRDKPCPDCRVIETLRDGLSTERSERRNTRDEDTSEWEISTYPIRDESEQVVQAILLEQDVTDRRHLESILTQSEKLAAIGQLAAGVAHEINNPLTAIIANAQILHRELPAGSDLQESVDLIARAGARATQVVRNLLDFARKEEYHLGLTDLNETLERALELVQHELLSRGVRMEFSPDPDLPPILASQDHLQSVWLNLLLNAIDSLDKTPGEIKIVTRRIGREIHISVRDNGKGIPPDRLTRIFEPFYTTKAPGRGTGLGLSVSHRIVKQHGGRISVESHPGTGSSFTVILPTS